MAKDITLKSPNGDEIYYPKTVTELVYDNETGDKLSDIINYSIGNNKYIYKHYINLIEDKAHIVPTTSLCYTKIRCKEGDEFYIHGAGGVDAARLYGFIDKDDNVISVADKGLEYNLPTIIKAPANSDFIVANFSSSKYGLYKKEDMEYVFDSISETNEFIKKEEEIIGYKTPRFIYGYYYALTGLKPVLTKFEGENSFYYTKIKCEKGDEFIIKGKGGYDAARLYGFIDKDDNIISVADKGTVYLEYETIVAPANAYYLIANFTETICYGLHYKNMREMITEISELKTHLTKDYSFEFVLDKGYKEIHLPYNIPIGVDIDVEIIALSDNAEISNNASITFRTNPTDTTYQYIILGTELKYLPYKKTITTDRISNVIRCNNIGSKANYNIKLSWKYWSDIDIHTNNKANDDKEMNVLIISNSFGYNGAYRFGDLANYFGKNLYIECIGKSGSTFDILLNYCKNDLIPDIHWKNENGRHSDIRPIEKTIKEVLKSKKWDWVVFHQQSLNSIDVETFQPYLDELIDFAKLNSQSLHPKIALQLTWANGIYDGNIDNLRYPLIIKTNKNNSFSFEIQSEMATQVMNSYKEAFSKNRRIDKLIPSGTAIANYRNFNESGFTNLQNGYIDYTHLNQYGIYLTGLVWLLSFYDDIDLDKIPNNLNLGQTDFMDFINCAINAIRCPYTITNIV